MLNGNNKKNVAAWDSLYQLDDDENSIWGDDPAEYLVTKVVGLLRSERAQNILVAPSGDGRNILPIVSEIPGITAVDVSPSALEILKANCCKAGLPIPDTIMADVYDLPFASESFDAVLCWDLLSHLEKPLYALRELLRVLRSDGLVITNFFADDDPSIQDDGMQEVSSNVLMNDMGICYWLYNETSINQMAVALGLSKFDIEPIEWWEKPHIGYREYEHLHRGYVFKWKKES